MIAQHYALQIFSLIPLLYFATIAVIIVFSIKRISVIRRIRSKEKAPSKNQFIFQLPYTHIIITLLAFPTLAFLNKENLPNLLPIYLLLFVVAILSLFANKQIFEFHEDYIKDLNEKVVVDANEITGISISSEEINFHTATYRNHYTFEAKKLTGKTWLDFQAAVEHFASVHPDIYVEKG